MGHTPYGYRIENGVAVVDEAKAEIIRTIYEKYLSGSALIAAAGAAGLKATHSTVKRLLQNKHYLGDDYYPAIIDRETFEAAEAERIKRADELGRGKCRDEKPVPAPPTLFHMKPKEQDFGDPFMEAEYMYSLIESEG